MSDERNPREPEADTSASSGRSPMRPRLPEIDAVVPGAVSAAFSTVARPSLMRTSAARGSVKGTSLTVTMSGSRTMRPSIASARGADAVPDMRSRNEPVILPGSSGLSHAPSVATSGSARSSNDAGAAGTGASSTRQPSGRYSSSQLSGRSPDADTGPRNPRAVRLVSHSRPSRTSTAALSPSTNGLSPPPSSAPASEAFPVRRTRRRSKLPDASSVPEIVPSAISFRILPAGEPHQALGREIGDGEGCREFVRRLNGRMAGQRGRPVGHLRGDIQPARLERELCFSWHGHERRSAHRTGRDPHRSRGARYGTLEAAFHGSACRR